jgi:hypothetical protein
MKGGTHPILRAQLATTGGLPHGARLSDRQEPRPLWLRAQQTTSGLPHGARLSDRQEPKPVKLRAARKGANIDANIDANADPVHHVFNSAATPTATTAATVTNTHQPMSDTVILGALKLAKTFTETQAIKILRRGIAGDYCLHIGSEGHLVVTVVNRRRELEHYKIIYEQSNLHIHSMYHIHDTKQEYPREFNSAVEAVQYLQSKKGLDETGIELTNMKSGIP